MNNSSRTDPLEMAIHVIFVLLGIIVLGLAYDFQNGFWQSLLIDDSLVLVRDDFAEDLSEYSFFRSLALFHQAHEYVFGEILDYAERFHVSLVGDNV